MSAGLGLTVELDWRAYFVEFCRLHGGDPVRYKERLLLFRDGWTYAAHDHRGPEWPPPKDRAELRALRRAYWLRRRATVLQQASRLERQIASVREAAATRSAPLMMRLRRRTTREVDGVAKRVIDKTDGPLDLRLAEERLRLMREALAECEAQLTALRNPIAKGAGDASDSVPSGRFAGADADEREGETVPQPNVQGFQVGRSEVGLR